MAFVAHLQEFGNEHLDVDLFLDRHRFLEHRVELLLHPAQAGQHFFVAGAKAEHLAEAFVDRAVRAVAERLVFENPDRHAVGNDASHRAYRAVHVAGVEFDCAARGELFCFRKIFGEAFVNQAAHDRAALRTAHAFPGHRRACVQNRCFCHTGNLFARDAETDDGRLRGEDATERFLIGGFDLCRELRRFQLAQVRAGRFVAARNGLPVHVNRRFALTLEVVVKRLDAKVHNVQFLIE
ncbi:hypothetical protein SDC9_139934 [bioreactor metagenome]|uniref:Uncharacterized protein n=1 Tax=bioreactor metagenome TaxID=1076179 RepID=A0A645DUJ6_9ZZZZ